MAFNDDISGRPSRSFGWGALAGLFQDAWARERRRRRWLLVGLLAAGVIFAATQIGGGGNGSANPGTQAFARLDLRLTPPIKTVPQSERALFAILRQPANPRIRMPASLAQHLTTGLLGRRSGLNPSLARGVSIATGNAWLVPGADRLCMQLAGGPFGGGLACAPSNGAARGYLVTWTGVSQSSVATIVNGLAPDGYSKAIFKLKDGTTQTLPVRSNMYGGNISQAWNSLTLSGSGMPGLIVNVQSG
jgi:hypothetical protein